MADQGEAESQKENNADARDAEHVVAFLPAEVLPTIREDVTLIMDRKYSVNEDSDFRESIEMSDEQASLIRSGLLSRSYTEESYHKFTNTDQAQPTYSATETVPENSSLPFHGSVMTDLQASLFVPSLLLSGYSSVKRNYDQIVQRSIAQSLMRRSVIGSQSVMVSLIEKISDDRGASFGLTISNLLPCLLGSSLFTMPYALRGCGYVSIIFLVLLAILANYTSFLLLDSMYETSPRSRKRKRVCGDYVDIAKSAFGTKMGQFMNVLLLFFLFSADIVLIILSGSAFYTLLNAYIPVSKIEFTAICSLLIIPTLLVKKLSHLAYLSMAATACIILGAIACLVLFILSYQAWKHNASAMPVFDWEYFALSISVWLYSLIIHHIQPQIEGCMRHPVKMKAAVYVSFGVATVFKILFGIFGAMSFGMSTMFLISDNVITLSRPVGSLINALIGTYAIVVFPLNFFVVGDAIDAVALGKNQNKFITLKKGGKYHYLWILLSRFVAVGLGLAIAVSVPYFGPVVGILGAVLGTLLVFFLPCLFHLKIRWKRLSVYHKILEILIIIVGLAAGAIGLYASIKNLYKAITG